MRRALHALSADDGRDSLHPASSSHRRVLLTTTMVLVLVLVLVLLRVRAQRLPSFNTTNPHESFIPGVLSVFSQDGSNVQAE